MMPYQVKRIHQRFTRHRFHATLVNAEEDYVTGIVECNDDVTMKSVVLDHYCEENKPIIKQHDNPKYVEVKDVTDEE